jgi:methionyl-tRNA formyltransferase
MDEFVSWARAKAPDIIVVFSMSQLLPRKVFDLPAYGALNLHPSFLPEYRGPNPEFWQYYFQDLSPGITVHYIDSKEDTGDIVHQTRLAIPLGIKSPDWVNRLVRDIGVPLLLRSLDEIEAGVAARIAQPELSPTIRARILTPEEHSSIVDWESWPIDRIWHLLRGTESWLNCLELPSGFYRGQRWEILDFERGARVNGPPGSIHRDERGYYVSCRDGAIRLKRNFSMMSLIQRLASLIR